MKENTTKDQGTVVIELVVVLGIILGAIMFVTIITTNVWDVQPREVNITHDYRLLASADSSNGFYIVDVVILEEGNVDKLVVKSDGVVDNTTIFEEDRIIKDRLDPENGENIKLIAHVGEYKQRIDTISVPNGL